MAQLFGAPLPAEGKSLDAHGRKLTMVAGIPRAEEFVSAAQSQTRDAFGFKWAKRDTFEGETAIYMKRWLAEKYGDVTGSDWLFANSGQAE